ncbi:TonB-dependent receptor [Paraglaciecola sp.]|uniref:TonB-dependent receptor n=1 Tax=Paraglaciecola sp. TaxID=1920173 RepID=UPI00273DD13D|nr:TonB-dependent receptor [Paraglaciecola sp.]MDP5029578.1 TonB-dependent receptor [Paraglaciecola sp.]
MNDLKHNTAAVKLTKNRVSLAINKVLFGAVLSTLAVNTMAAQNTTEQQTDELEVISVSGSYSKSLEKAVDIKRSTVGFSDSVVATDIADFPEQNLAEALQRMPGVTIERNKGLGSKVNVRSLPSEFTHVSINGVATASGSGGRDVEFDIFASEIIQSVTVKKSPTAADEEGGIAGSVLISTARPFDYNERKLIVSAEGAHNSISEEIDPKFSFLASDTFGDWGALVSYSNSQRTNRTDSNSGINFRPLSRWLEKKGSDSKQAQSDQAAAVLERDTGIVINDRFNIEENSRVVFIDKVGDRVYLNDQDKWGATASVQYKPNNDFSLTFDAMLGAFDNIEDEYDAAAYSASSNSTLETIHDFDNTTLAQDGITVLTDVSYTYTQHEFLSKQRINNTDYSQYSLSLDWQLADWDVNALVGYSGAEKRSDSSNLKHVAYAPSRTRYTSTGGETIASASSAGFDMYNSPEQYLFESYQVDVEAINDDKYAAQLDFTKSIQFAYLPALSKVQFGLRYTDKSKERNYGSESVKGPSQSDSSWSGSRTLQDSELKLVTDIVSGGNYQPRDIQWMQIPNSYARNEFRYSGFAVDYAVDQFYRVDEEALSLYAMADFTFELADMPVDVNAGVRAVDTSVLSFGYHQVQNTDGSTGYSDTPISKEGSYKDFLPSLNLSMELTDAVIFRAAASKTLMRPALTNIAYKRSVSWNEFRYSDGNPSLEPTYANQWETGIEWYLENGGLLAASYFWKDIEGVVQNKLTGVVTDVEKLNADGSLDGYYDFDVYQPVNAEGSYEVKGIELIAQVPLSTLHESLEGFGINANYTLLDNSLTGSSDLGIDTPPEGLAESTYNLTVYYENADFDARISYNYKDKYVEYIERNMFPVYRDAYGQTDISVGYQLSEKVKISLKGINITDEATTGYTMDPAFPTMNEYSGRRISLGIRADL